MLDETLDPHNSMRNPLYRASAACLHAVGGIVSWITAVPRPGKHAGQFRWTGRCLAVLTCIWFFVLGPGNLLASVHPGFRTALAGNLTVYFQGDIDAATLSQVLRDAGAACDHGREFWGDPPGSLQPISIYLCSSRSRWFQLGLCNDGNAVTVGSGVLLYPKGIGKAYLSEIMGVELSHAIAVQHVGEMQFWALPSWAEEGLATYLGAPGWSSEQRMVADLQKTPPPHIQRMSTLNNRVQWTSAYENNPPVAVMYSHARHFVEFLLDRYGVERFRSFLRQASFFKNPNDVFESVYKTKLEDADQAWLAEGKLHNHFPSNAALAPGSVVASSVVRWVLPHVLLALGLLWLLRQMCRIGRFAASAIRAHAASGLI